jgi:hypothetical protein
MSHNKITVQGQNPDSSGNVSLSSLSIGDLNNVTITTPSADQVIKYDGAGYVNGAAPAGDMEYILIGQGESAAYSTSAASSLAVGQSIEFYDTNPINTITGATLSNSTGDWYNAVTLPVGKYWILTQTRVEFSASGYIVVQWKYSTSFKTSALVIGDNANSYAGGASTTISSFTDITSTGQPIDFEIIAASNVDSVANQGNTIAEFTSCLIIKVAT